MKKLESLEKYVRVPDTNFYGAYFYDGEDIELHNEKQEFKDDQGNNEIILTIQDKVVNGVFKKHKLFENIKTGVKEETYTEYPLKEKEMLIFVMNEGFTKTHTPMITIDEAIKRYKLLDTKYIMEDSNDIKGNEK